MLFTNFDATLILQCKVLFRKSGQRWAAISLSHSFSSQGWFANIAVSRRAGSVTYVCGSNDPICYLLSGKQARRLPGPRYFVR